MFPKLITLKKGNFMKITPRLRNRTSSTSRGYNRSNRQHSNRHTKNLFNKSIVSFSILLLLLCLCLSQFSYYGKAAEPVVGPIGLEKYITIWTFGEPDYFNTTETTIADNEVVLRSYNYHWNQTSKKDFEKGDMDNVTVNQKSIVEKVYSENFESENSDWVHGINSGGKDEWQYGNVSLIPEFIGTYDSGSYVWATDLGGKYDDSGSTGSDYYLKSPNIDLTEYENIEMSFWHYYDFEDDSNYNDGGIIEVSIDNGQNWEQIDPKTGYIGTIEDPDNPLHDPINPTWCFAGNSTKWEVARFDLSNYAGNQSFSVRFRFATNGDVSDYGWYIDDIEITSTTSSDGEVELMPRNIGIGTGDVNIIERPAGETVIDTNNPVNVDGLLTKWTVNIVNLTPPARGMMKIFRNVSGEFIFVDQTDSEDITTGENTFDCEIEVEAGDYIGWYGENAKIFAKSEGSAFNMSGNISEDFPISSWTPIGYTFSIMAEGQSIHPVGTLTSQVFDAGSSAIWEEIRWGEDFLNPEVDIVLQTRTGNSSDTQHSSWSDWSSFISENKSSAIDSPNARYIQFKATLTSSQQPYTPSLSDTSIFYRKYSPHGEVETDDLIPGVTHEPLGGMVVQWLGFSADVVSNGQFIGYYYSLDSGETWQSIPENNDLTSVNVLEGKVRLKVNLSTADTTISPVVEQMDLTYSSARPDMGLFVEADKKDVKPGDTISYLIFYDNKGRGDARDVIITLELDVNVSYIEDNSPVPSTIEDGNIRRWHFDIVNPGNRSFFVYAKVKELKEDASISTLAVLNYTDLGGHSYPEVNSTGLTIKVMVEQDLLPYYLSLGAIIIIISFIILTWHRYRVLREAEKIILIEDIEKGIGYLVMEENPSKSYGVFSDLIDEGYSGLCITRTFPGRVISNYSFEGVTILWLSRARDENSILPTNLSALLRSAKDFLEANEEAVILLDGLEYLMVHNDFQRVLKMVHGLNELTAINDARLIIPLNPVTLDKEKLAILKRDLKMLG